MEGIGRVKVYSHPDLFKNSYSISGGNKRLIGIPLRREILENRGAEFIFNTNFKEIVPDLIFSGEIPREIPFEKGDKNQVLKTKEGYIKDPILDDQTLFISTKKGLIIILGCSHAGMINIINYAIEKTGQEHIDTIIGGTHLGPASEEVREKKYPSFKKI